MFNFRNDYSEIGHPTIMKELNKRCLERYVGYGFDTESEKLEKYFSKITNVKQHLYILAGGTITNLILIDKALEKYQAVITVETGHINVHETGAVETTGHKIITVNGVDGKITAKEINDVCKKHQDCHMVMPKLVYIANLTDIGTVYTKEELIGIYKACKDNGLKLFIDGARLATALTSKYNDNTIIDIAENCDAFYIGGTKNGLPYGEALLIKDEQINKDFRYHLKNKGGMFAKGFVGAIMFAKLFEDDLFYKLAKNSNQMMEYIVNNIKCSDNILYHPQANILYLKLDKKVVKQLRNDFMFEEMGEIDGKTICRFVTSYSTKKQECVQLVKTINSLVK